MSDGDELEISKRRIGRFQIKRLLRRGSFGLLFLGYDEALQKLVAITVPHHKLAHCQEKSESNVNEAHTNAHAIMRLAHPDIECLFDFGVTDYFPWYAVSLYVNGTNLASRLKQSRLSIPEAVETVATVAEALHQAHERGLVHRNIDPENILLCIDGRPCVANFCLTPSEQNLDKGVYLAGTLAYLSPEQARGDSLRVDCRSDVFSLGVVFYELLVGKRPFDGESAAEVMEKIQTFEPTPLRQFDDHIPKELYHICFKAISKQATDRYSTAKEMADDLTSFSAKSY